MSSSHAAIAVRGLSKSYTIRRNQTKHTTLADAVVDRIKHPFRRAEKEAFWALRNLSFEVAPGEIVGIIGRNGAGKSTLLKILSRITRPTGGEVELHGRVGSLLEVGTGFHQELTGRENIFLSGTILGMKRREIKEQFDAIVDFAGVEQFLDTPVKRYSSGMYVRLAFSVAAHLNPEILLIDEVLAVGDTEFQNKCLRKMKDVATSGRTVLFVSHQMSSVAVLCTRGAVLESGMVAFVGDIKKAISNYTAGLENAAAISKLPALRSGSGEYRYVEIAPLKTEFDPAEPKQFRYKVQHANGRIGQMYTSAHLFNESGFEVAHFDSRVVGSWLPDGDAIHGTFCFDSPWLKPGKWRLDFYLCTPSGIIDFVQGACFFSVNTLLPYRFTTSTDGTASGAVLGNFEWKVASDPSLPED